eukprot:TRINITY_DN3102_c0_g2_i1.p3 TRINITY_DN3102_c0_g2~~TRINITY_DN3102_c0_g2_i1.p3  ORF type:complete len:111 (-),score=0.52 TRINITY_DN3102_c0_g2_i1:496-828(-)
MIQTGKKLMLSVLHQGIPIQEDLFQIDVFGSTELVGRNQFVGCSQIGHSILLLIYFWICFILLFSFFDCVLIVLLVSRNTKLLLLFLQKIGTCLFVCTELCSITLSSVSA